jgi:hypothetical protein
MIARSRRLLPQIHPSAFLLLAQLLFLLLYAAFDGSRSEGAVIGVFNILVLMLRVWVIRRSPAADWIGWTLAIPALGLSLLTIFSTHPDLLMWSALLDSALYFYAAASMIAYMLEDTTVTTDELFAAGVTFTLLAWGFAYAYLVCQMLIPGSFIGAGSSGPETFIEMLFLSFSNLSATGLSDIIPVKTTARVLVMLEQFAGVGYIAVVVSRLIGMTLQSRDQKSA